MLVVIRLVRSDSKVQRLTAAAKREDVDLFPRFNVMKHWSEVDHMAFERFVSPDGLHMNDWGYACMAKGLGVAIAEAAQRPVLSAKAISDLVRWPPTFPTEERER